MCEKCLLASQIHLNYAMAAEKLSSAATTLHNINQESEAKVLSAAAADMFRAVDKIDPRKQGDKQAGTAGTAEKPKPGPGWFVDPETGTCFLNGDAVGELANIGGIIAVKQRIKL